ncbi:MAG: hypothetical protein K8S16_08265 [Bacteroidales bacterium]|nr:hypothetical protein [Bacteroidales bacterium]
MIGQYTVVEIGKEITVPAGKFNTFVVQDTYYDRKVYYNREYGIIKLESTSSNNSGKNAIFELVAKNF